MITAMRRDYSDRDSLSAINGQLISLQSIDNRCNQLDYKGRKKINKNHQDKEYDQPVF